MKVGNRWCGQIYTGPETYTSHICLFWMNRTGNVNRRRKRVRRSVVKISATGAWSADEWTDRPDPCIDSFRYYEREALLLHRFLRKGKLWLECPQLKKKERSFLKFHWRNKSVYKCTFGFRSRRPSETVTNLWTMEIQKSFTFRLWCIKGKKMIKTD